MKGVEGSVAIKKREAIGQIAKGLEAGMKMWTLPCGEEQECESSEDYIVLAIRDEAWSRVAVNTGKRCSSNFDMHRGP